MNNLDYKQIRNLNTVLQHGFALLFKNIFQIILCLVVFLLPLYVLFNFISIKLFATDINLLLHLKVHLLSGKQKFIQLIFSGAMILVLVCVYNIIINRLIEYKHQKNFTGNFFNFTKDNIIGTFQRHYSNTLYSVLLFSATYLIVDYVMYYFVESNTNEMQNDPFLFYLERIPYFIFSIIIMPLLVYILFTSLFVSYRDKLNVFLAITKVRKYLNGKLMNTYGNCLLFCVIYSLIIKLATLPAFAIGFFNLVNWDNQFAMEVLSVVLKYYELFAKSLSIILLSIFCIYHYTSLEEKVEASVIKEKINSI